MGRRTQIQTRQFVFVKIRTWYLCGLPTAGPYPTPHLRTSTLLSSRPAEEKVALASLKGTTLRPVMKPALPVTWGKAAMRMVEKAPLVLPIAKGQGVGGGDGVGAVDVGEDHRLTSFDPVEGDQLAAGGKGA